MLIKSQLVELIKNDSYNEEKLNESVKSVVSEKLAASGGRVVNKKDSAIFNEANVKDFVVRIPYLNERALTAMLSAPSTIANGSAIVK